VFISFRCNVIVIADTLTKEKTERSHFHCHELLEELMHGWTIEVLLDADEENVLHLALLLKRLQGSFRVDKAP
jgi:hypothetical protein